MTQHDDKEAAARERRARKFAELDQASRKSAIQLLLSRQDGRKFLWWLLEIGAVNANPFRGINEQTNFNCGVLNVGLQIQAGIIEADPSGYLTMLQENDSEHRQRADYITRDADNRSGEPGGYDGNHDD